MSDLSSKSKIGFSEDFVWGAAAASYQIEGAADEDGKGRSVWDEFCRKDGAIKESEDGHQACDHYHRYTDDVRLMAGIGIKAYRLSVSWPRILPQGTGKINFSGLDFYNKLIDQLLAAGIDPWVTIFHWDYPWELFRRGGWLHENSSDWFADYTAVLVDKFSDRVTNWLTLNEPQCFIGLGHQTGYHAPGLRLPFAQVLQAAHNTLLAHGKSVQIIRSRSKNNPQVGLAPVGLITMPGSDDPVMIRRAQEKTFSITRKDVWNNTWFADAMILGKYPEDGLLLFAGDLPPFPDSDMKIINQALDFYGVNIYHGMTLADDKVRNIPHPGCGITTMDWPVTPDVLYWGPKMFYERYGLPIVVTENGMGNTDWIQLDGKIHDPQRIDYMHRHLKAYKRALADGVEARGYFYWSVMDNFEWAEGYRKRFGLIYVDYQSQERRLKDSAGWYQKVIAANGRNL